jgi:hypothetical protein
MPKREKVLAQSKRTAHHPNFLKNEVFKLVYLIVFKKGEKSLVSSKNCKTLLNTKRRISLKGVLFKSKENHLKQGEKISNLENASFNLIHVPLTICKKF